MDPEGSLFEYVVGMMGPIIESKHIDWTLWTIRIRHIAPCFKTKKLCKVPRHCPCSMNVDGVGATPDRVGLRDSLRGLQFRLGLRLGLRARVKARVKANVRVNGSHRGLQGDGGEPFRYFGLFLCQIVSHFQWWNLKTPPITLPGERMPPTFLREDKGLGLHHDSICWLTRIGLLDL